MASKDKTFFPRKYNIKGMLISDNHGSHRSERVTQQI